MSDNQNRSEHSQPEGSQQERVIIPIEQARQAQPSQPQRSELKGILEALLFAAAGPLSTGRLAELAGASSAALIREVLEELKAEYDGAGHAFALEEIAGGYQLLTRQDFQPWVNRLRHREHEDRLSQAALETLAIIAYRQPITRAEIEDIRGVQSGYILRSLLEKSLVRVVGRSEELGRPLLYGTSREFLEVFGLPSLKALPKLDAPEPPPDSR